MIQNEHTVHLGGRIDQYLGINRYHCIDFPKTDRKRSFPLLQNLGLMMNHSNREVPLVRTASSMLYSSSFILPKTLPEFHVH